jgi:hypothetical protein
MHPAGALGVGGVSISAQALGTLLGVAWAFGCGLAL